MSTIRSPVDQYGFHRPDDFDYDSYDHFMSSYLAVLARRATRWSQFMKGSSKVKKSRKVKRFVRKGIPSDLRGQVWMDISGANKKKKKNPGRYKEALDEHSGLDERTLHSITTDIDRTFPENVYFGNTTEDKRQSLSNVLLAYAVHNPRIGYCQMVVEPSAFMSKTLLYNRYTHQDYIDQASRLYTISGPFDTTGHGLNYITGLLLLIVKDEESVFWLLDMMISNILPDYYAEGMHALQVEQGVLSEIVRSKLPEVYAHIEKIGLSYSVFSTQWFICLYVDILPVETVLRIWDCLFFEGAKVLLRVAVTLMRLHQEKLLAAHDFTKLFSTMKEITQGPSTMDCHQFMQHCFEMPGSLPMRWIKDLGRSRSEALEQEAQEMDTKRQNNKSENTG